MKTFFIFFAIICFVLTSCFKSNQTDRNKNKSIQEHNQTAGMFSISGSQPVETGCGTFYFIRQGTMI